MQLFLDSANRDEIRAAAELGYVDGVTTNPALLATQSRPLDQLVQDICAVIPGPVCVPVRHERDAEIVKEVEYFAQRQGIDLVVRFNSGQIDPQDRKSVLEGVNRAVVFQQRLNITGHILNRLNGPAQSSETANKSTVPRPRH